MNKKKQTIRSRAAGRFLLPALLLATCFTTFLTADKKIDIYGYSDFQFRHGELNGSEIRAFAQNRTTLILSSEFENRWNFFLNLKFSGSFEVRSIGSMHPGQSIPSTASKGKMELEESWANYTVSNKLKIRAGLFYAPFGYFNNIQDKSPIYTSVRPPMIYDDGLRGFTPVSIIPDKANLEISGVFTGRKFQLHYQVYTGNGLGNTGEPMSSKGNFSVGSRVLLNFDENVKIGISGYLDNAVFEPFYVMHLLRPPMPGGQIPEVRENRRLIGVDADLTFSIFNLIAEYIYNTNTNNLFGKFDRAFYFVHLNAEVLKNVRLYSEISHYDDKAPAAGVISRIGDGIYKHIAGINYKPNWKTAIKAEVQHYYYLNAARATDTIFVASLSVLF